MFITTTSRRTLSVFYNVSERALAAASSRVHFHSSSPTWTSQSEATLRMQALMLEIPADLQISSTESSHTPKGFKLYNEQSQSTGRRAPKSKPSPTETASASSPQPRGLREPRQKNKRMGNKPQSDASASTPLMSGSPIERQQNASRQQATAQNDRPSRPRRVQNDKPERRTSSPRMNTEGNVNSRPRSDSSPKTRGESSRRPREVEHKDQSAPSTPERNAMKPEANWQPLRKRAEELFGGSRSVLPVDSDVMSDAGVMSENSGAKWDGGKANRLRQAATDQGDYTTFLPSDPLIVKHLSGSNTSEQAVNTLNWMLARNVSVSNRQRSLAMGIAKDRLRV